MLDFFAAYSKKSAQELTGAYFEFEKDAFGKMDPTGCSELKAAVSKALDNIRRLGVREAMKQ